MALCCQGCGKPATPAPPGLPLCERCRGMAEEAERRWEEVHRAGGTWNTSQDDPFWRTWLTSRELFAVFHEIIPRLGTPIHSVLGGTVFAYEERGCRVEVWAAPGGVVVAYPVHGLYRDSESERAALPEFAGWIDHLRHAEPLELGRVRGRSSYGAEAPRSPDAIPVLKWAQAGDWAAMARRLSSGNSEP
jgi:hypothetical protein